MCLGEGRGGEGRRGGGGKEGSLNECEGEKEGRGE